MNDDEQEALTRRVRGFEAKALVEYSSGECKKALKHLRSGIAIASRSAADHSEFSRTHHFAAASCNAARKLIEVRMFGEAEGILRELLTWYYENFRGCRHPIAGGPLGAIGVYATLLRERGDKEQARQLSALITYPPARAPLFCFREGFKPDKASLTEHPVYGVLVQIGSTSPFVNNARTVTAPVLSTCVFELEILARHYKNHPGALDPAADANLVPSLVASAGQIAVAWKAVTVNAKA